MKKFNIDKTKKEVFSIRKLNVGVVTLAIMSFSVFGSTISSHETQASDNKVASQGPTNSQDKVEATQESSKNSINENIESVTQATNDKKEPAVTNTQCRK